MIQKGAWYFDMPKKVKETLDVLIEKSKTKTCVNTQEVIDIKNKVGWHNLPNSLDTALKLVGVNIDRDDRTLPRWQEVPSKVELLESKVESLDCRTLSKTTITTIPEKISTIKLVEYAADEDLTGDNETVNITVYFEDKSGDETPNVGKKLYLDKEFTKALVGYKGAFYFIRPSTPDEKVTMLVRSTGTVKSTKFEV